MPGEKTEKATPKRKEDERKKGNIFKSQELVAIFSLLVMFYSVKLLGPLIMNTIMEYMSKQFSITPPQGGLSPSDVIRLGMDAAIVFAISAMPLLVIGILIAVAITMAQTKGLVSFESMKFKPSHLNPINGIKKMFSVRGVVELVKAVIKVSVLGYIIYSKYVERMEQMPRLMDMEPMAAVAFLGDFIWSIVSTTGAIFIFVAVGDYVYQWWDFEKNLRMSKDEIKEEYKQTEGDPQVKGKIKQKQREMSQSRMMQQVPKADVIIRNPTHYAVALAYNADANRAPVVIAKGADLLALRIVRVAEENDIITIENKPLARGLYETVELEREIPEQYFQPVAEVLAFVYNLKKDLKT